MDKQFNDLASMRRNYDLEAFDLTQANENPFIQFKKWFEVAIKSGKIYEPNAMTVASVDENGLPSARIVLLKEIWEAGFVFYTNYDSRKGREILSGKGVSLLFYWDQLHRQVRIEGTAEKISREKSEKYFQSRPKTSQIGAWGSAQSQPVSRKDLEARKNELEEQYKDTDVLPCPPNWGGFLVKPTRFEFWQGRPSRLHDRITYELSPSDGTSDWIVGRLAP